jgi:hypothetical protein
LYSHHHLQTESFNGGSEGVDNLCSILFLGIQKEHQNHTSMLGLYRLFVSPRQDDVDEDDGDENNDDAPIMPADVQSNPFSAWTTTTTSTTATRTIMEKNGKNMERKPPFLSLPFSQMIQDMQSDDHSVSQEQFQTALWFTLQESKDDDAQTTADIQTNMSANVIRFLLDMTFPKSEDMELLFQALVEWCHEERLTASDNDDDVTSCPASAATGTVSTEDTWSSVLSIVSDRQYRWTTFQLLCSPTTETASMMTLWKEFRSASLVEVLQVLSCQGDLERLQIVWRRHLSFDLVKVFDLSRFPADTPAAQLTAWLIEDVVPSFQQFRLSQHSLMLNLMQRATAIAEQGDIAEALRWIAVLRPRRMSPDRLWKQQAHHAQMQTDEELNTSLTNNIEDSPSPCEALRVLDLQLQQLSYLVRHPRHR